jgi:hypothetical protein
MDIFQVWVTRTDGTTDVRVVDIENANWLLGRLSNFFVFKTCEPLRDTSDSSVYSFRVAHNSQMSASHIERILAKISEVKMIIEPLAPPIVLRAMPVA